MKRPVVYFVTILFVWLNSFQKAESSTPTKEEIELYKLVMAYRAEHDLPEISYAVSLTMIAQTHARDVYDYYDEIPSGCNSHSWSSHGNWERCDYYPDHRNAECMWSKPRELTTYQGYGYEIIHYYLPPTAADCTPEGALRSWQKSKGHNDCILNLNKWTSLQWKAIGIGMYKGVACIWFGEIEDPEGFYVIEE